MEVSPKYELSNNKGVIVNQNNGNIHHGSLQECEQENKYLKKEVENLKEVIQIQKDLIQELKQKKA